MDSPKTSILVYCFILLNTWWMTGCADEQYVLERWPDGGVKKEIIRAQQQFWMNVYYESEALASTGYVALDTLTKKGEWIYYTAEGKTQRIVNYIDGKRWGSYQFFHPNGTLASTGEYDAFELETGQWTTYYPDSTKESSGHYRAGLKIGNWRYYHDNGLIAVEEAYSSRGDDLLKAVAFDQYGILRSIRNYEDGILRREVITAVDSVAASRETRFHPNGNKEMEGLRIGEQLVGEWTFWHPSGAVYAVGSFSDDDQLIQEYQWDKFYEIERLPVNYNLNGMRIGTWEYWQESGKKLGRCKFRKSERRKRIVCSCRIKKVRQS